MFSFMIEDIGLFKGILESIEAVVEEVSLKVNQEGISTRAVDLAKVALVDLMLPRDFFAKFECEKEYLVTVDLNELRTRLKRTSSSDTVTLRYNTELSMVEVIIQGVSERIFRFRPLEEEFYFEKIPTAPYEAKAKILSKVFLNTILDAEIVSSEIIFTLKDNTVIAKGASESGEVITKIDSEQGGLLDIDVQNEASSKYKLDKLKDIAAKTSKISDTVDMYLGNNVPLKLDFTIPGGGKLTYYLAPFIG